MPARMPKRALICDHDELLRHTLAELIADAGFTIVGEAANVVGALQQLPFSHPTLVVLTTESLGFNPIEIIEELRRGERPPEVIVISHDPAARSGARAAGAFELTTHGDAEALLDAVCTVGYLLDTGERRLHTERRRGRERRQRQDWTKVIAQHRAGTDRRGGHRRAGSR